mgnify:CR=1 FL=1
MVWGRGAGVGGARCVGAASCGDAWRVTPREPLVFRSGRVNGGMPALGLLERAAWSAPRRVAMVALAAYLVVAVILLAVKATQLAIG